MSNSNHSVAIQRLFDDAAKFAYSVVMGKDAMVDVGDKLFAAGLSDPTAVVECVPALYDDIRKESVSIANDKGKEIKSQTAKSRGTQISKLANFAHMAVFAQHNDAVQPVYAYIRKNTKDVPGLGISGYTKVVACLVAMKGVLDKDLDADEATLRHAVANANKEKTELASDVVAKFADDWEALAFGTDKSEAPFPNMFGALDPDLAKRIRMNLAVIVAEFQRVEAEMKARLARAEAGLSV